VDVEEEGNKAEGVTSSSSQEKKVPISLCPETLEELKKDIQSIRSQDGALIVYTSGTTGKPKGAVHTHDSLHWQMQSMSEAWLWQQTDSILHCLPLHHIHGIVNALHCAHFNVAHVQFLQGGKFSPRRVWDTLIAKEEISVFMGVPTMYSYLLTYLDQLSDDQKSLYDEASYYQRCIRASRRLRLAVCGSSACPVPLMHKWKGISGQFLLERYGMSETGMILSNPYHPSDERIEGTVGEPMPYVKAKVASDGELLVRSKCMMSGYYKKPKQTREAFVDAYFRTGDQVSVDSKGIYTIKGRMSVDIIKHKGYKISALDVENGLLGHPLISECSVVGLDHEVYGQTIAAVVVKADTQAELDLNSWCADVLAPYQRPTTIHFVEQIPKNAMGKVNKKKLAQWISTLV
jgi:malonyl-CoA/methylmalonyl-CoA synthetase